VVRELDQRTVTSVLIRRSWRGTGTAEEQPEFLPTEGVLSQ
jgi:hypothetical protein